MSVPAILKHYEIAYSELSAYSKINQKENSYESNKTFNFYLDRYIQLHDTLSKMLTDELQTAKTQTLSNLQYLRTK
jgi:hypothetical protein